MKQILCGGTADLLSAVAGAVEYNIPQGGSTWNAVEAYARVCIPTGGTISRLYVRLTADPTNAGSSYAFTLMVNGVATALSCTINAGATTGSDLVTAPIAVAAGQTVSIRCTTSAIAPVAVAAAWSTTFTGSTAGESVCLGMMRVGGIAMSYHPIQGDSLNGTEIRLTAPVPTSGSFKNFYVALDVDPGVNPDSYTYTIRKNAAATALAVTIVADDTTGNDLVDTIAFNAGDLMSIRLLKVNTPANSPYAAFGLVFVSNTDGESIIIGGEGWVGTTAGLTAYNFFNTVVSWSGLEANAYSVGDAQTLRNLYVSLSVAPGGAETNTIHVRVAGANGGAPGDLTVTITGAATSGNDVANSFTASLGQTLGFRVITSGAAASTATKIGLVGYIDPSAGTTSPPQGRSIRQLITHGCL